MRLWTLDPRYLDARGLVALWRETLLAQKVLRGETRGYKHHPQLRRFQAQPDPVAAVAAYLRGIIEAAESRGYHFDKTKILSKARCGKIPATSGQLLYEWAHLRKKLRARDKAKHRELQSIVLPEAHRLFEITPGDVEPWEIRK